MTFHTSALYSGTGMCFYLNEDKSVFDASNYSKIKVTVSSPSEHRDMVLAVVLDGGGDKLVEYKTPNKDTKITYELDLTSLTGAELKKLSKVQTKFNAHEKPRKPTDTEKAALDTKAEQRTDEQKALVQAYEDLQRSYMATFNIHSIELVAKN